MKREKQISIFFFLCLIDFIEPVNFRIWTPYVESLEHVHVHAVVTMIVFRNFFALYRTANFQSIFLHGF